MNAGTIQAHQHREQTHGRQARRGELRCQGGGWSIKRACSYMEFAFARGRRRQRLHIELGLGVCEPQPEAKTQEQFRRAVRAHPAKQEDDTTKTRVTTIGSTTSEHDVAADHGRENVPLDEATVAGSHSSSTSSTNVVVAPSTDTANRTPN